MPQGGTLRIATTADADRTPVLVTVTDTGAGMTDEVRRRCLEPFFTTRRAGTGLGLAMAYGIIQRHAARSTSRASRSRHHVPDPAARALGSIDRDPPDLGEHASRPLRVLVVDDEPLMRQ